MLILYPMTYPFCDIHTHRCSGGLRLRSYSFADADFETRALCSPYSVGVHPWQADEKMAGEWMTALASEPAAAIGEIGLDYACGVDREVQRSVFVQQLDIARSRRLPVVLHVVRAFEPVMDILKGYSDLPAVVLHGFIGSPQQAEAAVRRGYFLSVGLRSFASPRTVRAIGSVTSGCLLLETDDSDDDISRVYACAAEVLGIPMQDLTRIVFENYKRAIG